MLLKITNQFFTLFEALYEFDFAERDAGGGAAILVSRKSLASTVQ